MREAGATRWSTIGRLDRRLVSRSARLPPMSVDRGLLSLTRAANHSGIWLGIAGGLAALGGSNRRAAVRGVVAIGGASFLANAVAKPLFPRRRPPDESVPFVRRLLFPPVSSSFPSGHAASAAAFATGVALESPVAGAVVAPLAVAVGYSRVHVGVHWPSDVLAGAALGAGVGYFTRRWWAVRDDEPSALGPEDSVAPLPGGKGLTLFVNAASGSAGDLYPERLRAALPAATVIELEEEPDIGEQIADAVADTDPAALGVVGGDGTVLAVASAATRLGLPLAVYAGGTLNHFARDAGVAEPDTTSDAVEHGSLALVTTAAVTADDESTALFLNTASLGGYPDVVRLREKWEPRFGKWPAAAAALVCVLAQAEPLRVRIDGADAEIWMLFVGNGRYSPADTVPMSRIEIHRGLLDVRYLRADLRFSRLRLACAAVAGTLGDSPTYVRRLTDSLDVEIHDEAVFLATDGEVRRRSRRFRFADGPRLAIFRRPRT